MFKNYSLHHSKTQLKRWWRTPSKESPSLWMRGKNWAPVFLLTGLLMFFSQWAIAQATISTTGTFANNNGSGTVTFNFRNGTSDPIQITDISGVTGTSGSVAVEVWTKVTPLNGAPGVISTANGWTQAATGTITGIANSSTTVLQPFFTGISIVVPANTTIAMAVYAAGQRYYTMPASPAVDTFTTAGVSIITGANIGYGGGAPNGAAPTNTPRGWIGSITFNPLTPCSGAPSAGTVPATMAVCPATPLVITAAGATLGTGMTNKWQSSAPGANTWTDIAGATSPTYSVPGGISIAADYRYITTCNSSNLSDTSSVVAVTVNPPSQCYCAVTSTSSTYGIANFTTTNGFTNINNSTGPNGYTDYTATHIVSQSAGLSFNFSLTSISSTIGVGIWVDWNGNGSFNDPGEQVYNSGSYVSAANGTITIPAGTPIGNYRMRVVGNYLSTNPTPCGDLGSASYGEAEDYTVSVMAPPSCMPPSALNVVSVASNSAVLGWTNNNTSSSNFEINWATQGTSLASGTSVFTSSNPYTLNGLTPVTNYRYYVRQICAAGDTSLWAGPFAFTTTCASFPAPFLEQFNTGALPNCWESTTDDATQNANGKWRFGSGIGYGADIAAHGKAVGTYAWVDASAPYSGIHAVTLTSPIIDVSSLTLPYLEFEWFKNHATAVGGSLPAYDNNLLKVQVNDGSGWNTVYSDDSNSPQIRDVAVALTGLTGTQIRVRFVVDKDQFGNGYFYDDMLIDNVSITEAPTACAGTPDAGIASVPDSICSGVDFDLTSNVVYNFGYEYQWQRSPAGANTWTNITGATTVPYTMQSGVNAPTDFRLIVVCNTSNMSDTSNIASVAGMYPPNQCYCVVTSTNTTYGISNFTTTNAITNINNTTGPGSYTDYSATHIVSQAAGLTFDFSVTSVSGTMGIGIWIDWNNNGSFDDPGEKVFSSGTSYVSSATGTITIPMTVPVGNYRMRVVGNYLSTSPIPCNDLGSQGYGEAEDYTVSVTTAPTCMPPSALNTQSVAANSASLAWTTNNTSSSNFEINWATQSTPLSGGTSVFTSSNPYNLTGLTPTTAYRFYVRQICTAGDTSVWAGPFNFTTACASFPAPFLEQFNTGALPNCWESTTDDPSQSVNGKWQFGSGIGYGAAIAAHGKAAGTYAWVDASAPYTGIHAVTLTSPLIDVSTLTLPYLEFDWFKNHATSVGGSMPAYDNNLLKVQVNDGSGWNTVFSDDSNSPQIREIAVALTGLTGTEIRLRFIVDKDQFGNGYFYDDMLIDNVSISEAPSPCAGTPDPGIAAVPDSICGGVEFDLTSNVVYNFGYEYQWQSSPAGANTWTNIAGATTVPYTMQNGVNAATDFRLIVVCNNSNLSDTSNVASVAGLYPSSQCYCIPSGTTASYFINNFTTTGGVQNISNLASGFSPNGYGDFTATDTVSQMHGETVNFNGDYSGGTFGTKIWVDWNRNGTFEPSEQVFASTSYVTSQAGSFDVPMNALPGATRMRVGISYTPSTGPADPCESGSREWEDYTFVVIPMCDTPVLSLGADTFLCTGSSITLDVGAANAGFDIEWNDGSTNQTLVVNAAGSYYVSVADGLCTATDTIVITEIAGPTADEIDITTSGGCNFSFELLNESGATEYSWDFGDGSPLNNSATPSHSYTANGIYTVSVTISNICGSETFTKQVECDDGTGIGNINIDNNVMKLYPNPTADFITIENNSKLNMETITIMNILGQVVYKDAAQSAHKHYMNVSKFASGVYTVRIQTNEGVVIRKFEVLK